MKKSQIILVATAVILVVVLYRLPRAVVENDPDMEPTARQEEKRVEDQEIEAADEVGTLTPIPEEVQSKINTLENQLNLDESKEKSATFADSLAQLYYSLEDYQNSSKYAELALEKKPSLERLKFAGEAYYNAWVISNNRITAQENVVKARSFFEELLEKDSSHVDIKVKLAMTYVSAQNPMRGILMLREVSEKHPENEQAQFNLGALSMQSGQFDKAVERFNNVINLNPENIEARLFKAVSLIELGNKREGRLILENLKSETENPEMLATIDSYLNEL